MPKFDIAAALADGYSYSEIASYLSDLHGFDLNAAKYDGVKDEEIAGFLSAREVRQVDKAESGLGAGVRQLGRLAYDFPTQLQGAAGALMYDPLEPESTGARWMDVAEKRNKERAAQLQLEGASEKEFLPGISVGNVQDASSSTGSSVLAMGPSIAGEVGATLASKAPNPAVKLGGQALSYLGGAAGSAGLGYKMDEAIFTKQLLDRANQQMVAAEGRPMNEAETQKYLDETADIRRQHGLWEASPEAVGNALEVIGLRKIFSGAAKGNLLGAVAGLVMNQATEHSTETITGLGQQPLEVAGGLRDERPYEMGNPQDWGTAFKEQAPVTAVLGGVTGGAAGLAGRAYRAVQPPLQAPPEPGRNMPDFEADRQRVEALRAPTPIIPPLRPQDFSGISAVPDALSAMGPQPTVAAKVDTATQQVENATTPKGYGNPLDTAGEIIAEVRSADAAKLAELEKVLEAPELDDFANSIRDDIAERRKELAGIDRALNEASLERNATGPVTEPTERKEQETLPAQPDQQLVESTLAAIQQADQARLNQMADGLPGFIESSPEYAPFQKQFSDAMSARQRVLWEEVNNAGRGTVQGDQGGVAAVQPEQPAGARDIEPVSEDSGRQGDGDSGAGIEQTSPLLTAARQHVAETGDMTMGGLMKALDVDIDTAADLLEQVKATTPLPRNIAGTQAATRGADTGGFLNELAIRKAGATSLATTAGDAQGFIADQGIRKATGTATAAPAADTEGFVRDQQIRREAMGRIDKPTRREGESARAFLARKREWEAGDSQHNDELPTQAPNIDPLKEPWRLTKEEYHLAIQSMFGMGADARQSVGAAFGAGRGGALAGGVPYRQVNYEQHARKVARAIRSGEAVPADVLAEYPGYFEKYSRKNKTGAKVPASPERGQEESAAAHTTPKTTSTSDLPGAGTGGLKPSQPESAANGILVDVEFLSNFIKAHAGVPEGDGLGEIPSKARVYSRMRRLRENLKVFDSVVSFDSVPMVNQFVTGQLSPKKLLHDKPVFEEIFSSLRDNFIPVIINTTGAPSVNSAGDRAEVIIGPDMAPLPGKTLPAEGASDTDVGFSLPFDIETTSRAAGSAFNPGRGEGETLVTNRADNVHKAPDLESLQDVKNIQQTRKNSNLKQNAPSQSEPHPTPRKDAAQPSASKATPEKPAGVATSGQRQEQPIKQGDVSVGDTVYFTDVRDETKRIPANFRGFNGPDQIVVVYDGGKQMALPRGRVFKEGGASGETEQERRQREFDERIAAKQKEREEQESETRRMARRGKEMERHFNLRTDDDTPDGTDKQMEAATNAWIAGNGDAPRYIHGGSDGKPLTGKTLLNRTPSKSFMARVKRMANNAKRPFAIVERVSSDGIPRARFMAELPSWYNERRISGDPIILENYFFDRDTNHILETVIPDEENRTGFALPQDRAAEPAQAEAASGEPAVEVGEEIVAIEEPPKDETPKQEERRLERLDNADEDMLIAPDRERFAANRLIKTKYKYDTSRGLVPSKADFPSIDDSIKRTVALMKKFVATVPEFRQAPVFTVVEGTENGTVLRFTDSYTYDFRPQVFGLSPQELKAGDRVRLDIDAWTGKAGALQGQKFVNTKLLGAKGWVKYDGTTWTTDTVVAAGNPPGGLEIDKRESFENVTNGLLNFFSKAEPLSSGPHRQVESGREILVEIGGKYFSRDQLNFVVTNTAKDAATTFLVADENMVAVAKDGEIVAVLAGYRDEGEERTPAGSWTAKSTNKNPAITIPLEGAYVRKVSAQSPSEKDAETASSEAGEGVGFSEVEQVSPTKEAPVEPEVIPEQRLLDTGFLREFRDRWQYKFAGNNGWFTADRKEDAVERARKAYEKTPESERLTAQERFDKSTAEQNADMERLYGEKSLPELRKEYTRMDREIASLQKAGRREFDGNGGRRTSAAVSNEGARNIGEQKLKLGRYIEDRERSEGESIQGTATGEEHITYAVSEPRGDGGQAAGVVRDRAGAGVRAEGGQLDLFTGATVPSLHQRRAKRSVFAQVKHAAAGTFSFSGGPVGTMAEIAGIARPIMDEAQESNLLVMLDEKNMPVAVLKHSVGGKASGPIDPGVVLGVAHSIKAVKTIWSVHNHPSGTAILSGADRNVATLLADATRGTGINFAGLVAVTPGGRFTGAHYRDGEIVGGDFFGDAIADKDAKVRGLTRKIKKLSDQPAVTNDNDISLWMMDNAPGQSGVLLLDNRNRPAAFVPMETATMAKLRTGEKGSGASELLATAEQVNATALVPISTDRGKAGEDAARNVAVFAHAHAFTVLDAIVDGQSARDLVRETIDDHKWRGGAKSAASAFFSKGEAVPAGDRADIPGELAQAFGKLRARVLMRKITVLESQEEAKALVRRLGGRLSVGGYNVDETLLEQLGRVHPGIDAFLSERGGVITLSELQMPKQLRGGGLGSKFMEILTAHADANGKTVALTADGDYGGSKAGQRRFYARFGFSPNKGRGKDYRISENMIRRPSRGVEITAKFSKSGAIQGLYANGKTYLVADGIAKNQAVPVLLHELGEHAAKLGLAGDREYQGILRSLEKRAEAQNATGEAIRAAMARVPEDTAPEHYWSEVAAYLVENKANSEIGIVKRILAFFKKWLYKAGAINADRLTPEDLVLFARAATLAHTGATYGEGVRQSVRESIQQAKAFFSKLQQVSDDKFGGMKAQSVEPFLLKQGVKKAEIEATGLREWLAAMKPTDKVTKEQLADLVRANTVEFEDVVLGEGKISAREWAKRNGYFVSFDRDAGGYIVHDKEGRVHKDWSGEIQVGKTEDEAFSILEDYIPESSDATDTHFSQYTEPGAVPGSYREMFVTAPKGGDRGEKPKNRFGNILRGVDDDGRKTWKDGHSQYSEIRNPIVRIRFNEVAGPNGERILRVEEVQGPSDENQQKMPKYLRDNIYQTGVKRILAYAKENGFDGVALATKPGRTAGETQADRYSLEKHLGLIEYEESDQGDYAFLARDHSGEVVMHGHSKSLDDIAVLLGKEVAHKMSKGEGSGHPTAKSRRVLSGLDLRVGGEGLKQLYDTDLPNIFKAWGGAKMGDLGGMPYIPVDKAASSYPMFSQRQPSERIRYSKQFDDGEVDERNPPPIEGTTTEDPYEQAAKIERSKYLALRRSTSATLKSIAGGVDKYLGAISTRLRNISPKLEHKIRQLDFNIGTNHTRDVRAVEPLLKLAKQKMSKMDFIIWDLARKNSDVKRIDGLVKKYGIRKEYDAYRRVLDRVFKEAQEVGIELGWINEYAPRVIKDAQGFLNELGRGNDWPVLTQKLKEVARRMDITVADMTPEMKADIISNMLFGGYYGMGAPGSTKERSIAMIPPKLNQYYMDSDAALMQYLHSMRKHIEARRFFGKVPQKISEAKRNMHAAMKRLREEEAKEIPDQARIEMWRDSIAGYRGVLEKYKNQLDYTDNIAQYVIDLMESGELSPENENVLKDILNARFNEHGTRGVIQAYKNFSYLDTMGSPISAITQIGDLAWSIYANGWTRTLRGISKSALGKAKITKEDVGIERIAQEFADTDTLSKAVAKVFRWIGLEKMDTIGKESFLNGAFERFVAEAKKDPKALERKLEQTFAEDAALVVDDLQNERITENVKLLVYSDLLNFQPAAMSEMPEQYLLAGNGRLFYMLKTYTLKQFDVFRREGYNAIRRGTKTEKIDAIRKVAYLAMLLVLANGAADELKDWLLGRKTDLSDRVTDNVLRLFGVSKYMTWKARTEGYGSAIVRQILPPFKFVDSLSKDILSAGDGKGLQTPQSVPVVGKLAYWHLGRGKDAHRDLWEIRFSKERRRLEEIKERIEGNPDLASKYRQEMRRLKAFRRAQYRINQMKSASNKLRQTERRTGSDYSDRIDAVEQRRIAAIKRFLGAQQ